MLSMIHVAFIVIILMSNSLVKCARDVLNYNKSEISENITSTHLLDSGSSESYQDFISFLIEFFDEEDNNMNKENTPVLKKVIKDDAPIPTRQRFPNPSKRNYLNLHQSKKVHN